MDQKKSQFKRRGVTKLSNPQSQKTVHSQLQSTVLQPKTKRRIKVKLDLYLSYIRLIFTQEYVI